MISSEDLVISVGVFVLGDDRTDCLDVGVDGTDCLDVDDVSGCYWP